MVSGERPANTVVDEETERWPVRPEFRGDLDGIKYKFEAVPLPVYIDEQFVEPTNVSQMLSGALVEINFELRHFCIQKIREDSFNSYIEQIDVLQPGEAPQTTPFKRKKMDLRGGPVWLKKNHWRNVHARDNRLLSHLLWPARPPNPLRSLKSDSRLLSREAIQMPKGKSRWKVKV
jgi:hypothetical protein